MKKTFPPLLMLLGLLILDTAPLQAQKFESSLGIQFFTFTRNRVKAIVTLPGMYGPRPPQEVLFRREYAPYIQVAYHIRYQLFETPKGGIAISSPMGVSLFATTGYSKKEFITLSVPILSEYSIGFDPFKEQNHKIGFFIGAGVNPFYHEGRKILFDRRVTQYIRSRSSRYLFQVNPAVTFGIRIPTKKTSIELRYTHGFSTNYHDLVSNQGLSISWRLNRIKHKQEKYFSWANP